MNERNTLTIEKLDIEEYTAAMKAVNEVRQKRANEAAKAKAKQIIIDAVNEAMELVHPIELVDTVDEMLWNVMSAAEDEACAVLEARNALGG